MFLLNYKVQVPPLRVKSSLEISADIKSGQNFEIEGHILFIPASLCTQSLCRNIQRPFDDVWCWQVQVTAGEEPSQLPGVERGGARVGPMPRSDLLALLKRHTALFFHLVFCHSVNSKAFGDSLKPSSAG